MKSSPKNSYQKPQAPDTLTESEDNKEPPCLSVFVYIPQTSEEILQIHYSKCNEYKLQLLKIYTLIMLNCNSGEIRQETGLEDI